MRCPSCGVDAAIMHTRTEVEGDTAPEMQTQVFAVLEYQCRNPACERNGEPVGETRHRLFPAEDVTTKGGESV